MRNNIIKSLENKNIAILGFGIEGKSTYKYIRKHLNQKITILDSNENLLKQNSDLIKDKNLEFVLGAKYLSELNSFDVIIKSPGIVVKDSEKFLNKITSQMSLVLEETDSFVIGVTGTKGKSTTSSLIYDILKKQNKNVILVGNIGLPILDYIDDINDETIIVAETSSYQLEYLRKSPQIGLILNLYEEHLDHHGTLENYYNSKLNMFKHQNKDDYAIYLSDNETLNSLVNKNIYKGNHFKISFKDKENIYCDNQYIYYKEEILYDLSNARKLIGIHNVNNIMFALAVAKILNLDIEKTVQAINEFQPLKHRLENVGRVKDITFYDDAIATIPEATISAIKSLKNIDTLIFGGMDRGISYNGFAEKLLKTNVNNFICLPSTGEKIAKELNKFKTNQNVYLVEEMEDAVSLAFKVTKKGYGCLLSPAAPSYNKYKNFAAKGDHYVECIKNNK